MKRYQVSYKYLHRYGWRWAVCVGSEIIYHTSRKSIAEGIAEAANKDAPSLARVLTQEMIDSRPVGQPPIVLWRNFLSRASRA